MALVFVGAVLLSQGDLDQASARFDECAPIRSAVVEQPTDFVVDCTWLLFAAIVALLRSDDGQASELLEAGLARTRARGDRSFSCNFLVTLAFPVLAASVGLAVVYGGFAVIALMSFVFVKTKLPDMTGRELEDEDKLVRR